MLRIILVLLLIPLFDILLLAAVAQWWLGWVLTVAVVVLTGLVGLLLVRAEGRHTMTKVQRKLAQGEPPTDELIDGGLLIGAGAFFLTPGLVTDALALLIVLPPTRWAIRAALKRWLITPYIDAKTGGFASGQVYVGGFPGEDGPGAASDAGGPAGTTGDAGGEFDPDDATDVDFDERDERG